MSSIKRNIQDVLGTAIQQRSSVFATAGHTVKYYVENYE